MRPRAVRKILATEHQGVLTTKGTEKRATKNMQLLLQHCCKTSWKAMLHVLPPTFKPVNNLIWCKTGLHACMFFCCLFLSTLRAPSIQTKTPGLNFPQLSLANGTALSKISQKEDNLARHTQILETFVPLFPSFRKFWLNAGKRSKDYISPLFMPWTN